MLPFLSTLAFCEESGEEILCLAEGHLPAILLLAAAKIGLDHY